MTRTQPRPVGTYGGEGRVDPSRIGDTINLGSGTEVTINDLASQIAVVTGRPSARLQHDRPRPGDVLRLCADMSHARVTLGFAPRVPLTTGLEKLLAWYQSQNVSPQELLEQEIVHNWKGQEGPGTDRLLPASASTAAK